MRWLIETIFGVYELARLAVITRFRFRGTWWKWRMQTAFGQGLPTSRRAMVRSVLDYGRWVHRMRREM